MRKVNEITGEILTLKIWIESTEHIYDYTGKISKTIILSEAPGLEYLFRSIKGVFKLIRVSPPMRDGKAIIPIYKPVKSEKKIDYVLKPITLSGEYSVEIGSTSDIINKLYNTMKQILGVRTRLKFENTIISYIVNDIHVVKPTINIDQSKVFTIHTTSPALLSNPYTPTQHIRRFTVNPGVFLWVPYMITKGYLSHDVEEARRAALELEYCLTEHYSTRYRVVFINYNGNREPAIEARVKYIITPRGEDNVEKCREILVKSIYTARVFGIGASRANGFGSISVSYKRPVKDM